MVVGGKAVLCTSLLFALWHRVEKVKGTQQWLFYICSPVDFTCDFLCTHADIRPAQFVQISGPAAGADVQVHGAEGGNVHISPLYTMAHSREIKGLSAMQSSCAYMRLLVHTCTHTTGGSTYTYLHCMPRHRDLQQVQMSKSMVAQSIERVNGLW